MAGGFVVLAQTNCASAKLVRGAQFDFCLTNRKLDLAQHG
jgi:hypothetical protein